jgi:hypothetical protein
MRQVIIMLELSWIGKRLWRNAGEKSAKHLAAPNGTSNSAGFRLAFAQASVSGFWSEQF